jgi:hypothetical protein
MKNGTLDFKELKKRVSGAWGVLTGTKFATKAQLTPRKKKEQQEQLFYVIEK